MRGESVTSPPAGGDVTATGSRAIEVRVAELRQLFKAIDPSPFREWAWIRIRSNVAAISSTRRSDLRWRSSWWNRPGDYAGDCARMSVRRSWP
jgi:hypothetical protein